MHIYVEQFERYVMDAGVHLAALLGAVLLLSLAGGKYFKMYSYLLCTRSLLCVHSVSFVVRPHHNYFPVSKFCSKK